MTQPALAAVDHYEFNVGYGINTLDLGTNYDGNYVNSVTGTVYEASLNYQEVTITTSKNIGTKRTLKVEIDYHSGMHVNFSDVFFTYQNGTEIPCYKSSVNDGTDATFYLYFESIEAVNNIYLCWGAGTNPKQDSYVFLGMNSTPEGVVYSTNKRFDVYSSDSLYGVSTSNLGYYTNADVIFSTTGYGSSHKNSPWLKFSIRGNNTADTEYYNSIGGWVESKSVYSVLGLWNRTEINPVNNKTSISVEWVNNSSIIVTTTGVNGTPFIQSNSSASPILKPNMFYFSRQGSANLILYSAYFYNSSNFSIDFGTIHTSTASEHPVTIAFDQTIFNTLNFTSSWNGLLEMDVDYIPHAVMLTPTDSNFTKNVILQFDVSPSNLSINYQIALDVNFYSLVNSGSSTGNISMELPEGQYYWRLIQPGGTFSEVRTFFVQPAPAADGYFNIIIKNELTNLNVSATVVLTNNTTTLQKSGSVINFSSSEVIAGNYTIRVNQTNYSTRYYEATSPGNYTFYILPTNLTTNNASVVYFSLVDNTNQFQYNSTKLEIIKQTPNGSILIQNSYFDASGLVVATLNQFDNYILKVISDDGHERILGNYIQAGQNSIQLVISEIVLKDSDINVHGGFTYNLTRTSEGIKLEWRNPNSSALTEPFIFQIHKDGELVMNVTSTAPFGLIHYVDGDGNGHLDPEATYEITFEAETTGGKIRVHEYYKSGGESVGINFEIIPMSVRIIVTLGLLVLVASQFNTTNSRFAAIVVSLIALFLSFISFFPLGDVILVLVWLLFISVVALKTTRR